MMRHAGIVLFTALTLLGCEQTKQEQQQVVARVGDAVLTRDEVLMSIDTNLKPLEPQMHRYISAWIKSELLYKEAVRKGIENTPAFQKNVDDVRRQIAVNELLEQMRLTDSSSASDAHLQEYFVKHSSEFFVRELMMKLNVIGFASREKANSFAASVTRGNSWENVVASALSETTSPDEMISSSQNMYFSEQTIFFPELWKVAQTLGSNDVSFPVRTPKGFFVVQMLSSVRKGAEPVFDLVKEEVRARYMRDVQQQRVDSLIGTLRTQNTVEILLPVPSQSDTALQSSHD